MSDDYECNRPVCYPLSLPDRIDSGVGDYGSANFQLSHLGCNYAKNQYSVDQFKEWLRFATEGTFEE